MRILSQLKGKERKPWNVPTAACAWKWGRTLAGPEAGRKRPALGGAGHNWTALLLSTQEHGWVREPCPDQVRRKSHARGSLVTHRMWFNFRPERRARLPKGRKPHHSQKHNAHCAAAASSCYMCRQALSYSTNLKGKDVNRLILVNSTQNWVSVQQEASTNWTLKKYSILPFHILCFFFNLIEG